MDNQHKIDHIFIFAGELSGDQTGATLMAEMEEYHFSGVGGPHMLQQGLHSLCPMKEFSVMGFSAVLRKLPTLYRLMSQICNRIISQNPVCVFLIDSPGFTLRLAAKLRKRGYRGKIVQYIAPSVWAWKRSRIDSLVRDFDLLLTIYPFETQYFSDTPLRTLYVGNPLANLIKQHQYTKRFPPNIVGIFPGSRRQEIIQNLPKQLETAHSFSQAFPDMSFALSIAEPSCSDLIHSLCRHSSLPLSFIPREHSYDLMKQCTLALATSGTVSLELALHSVPAVVTYNLSFINWVIAKYLFRINLPHYCIVNITGGKNIFPEIIDYNISSNRISSALHKLYSSPSRYNSCIADCRSLQSHFSHLDAGKEAAKATKELIHGTY